MKPETGQPFNDSEKGLRPQISNLINLLRPGWKASLETAVVTDAPRVTVVRHAIEEKIQTSKLKKDSTPSAAADSDCKCTVLARRAIWEA